ncbi:LysR family transcriptional regulator [Streptomyces polyrhachis]|uniref:LysR family transcriptional regulator n=1 Tax=Streptomyces polyrhachis TaxID=1282885 RepID=A0ABW2GGW2_9ACTN
MPHDLEPRLLRYFTALAEELHFSRAAQRLYISQQVLSREIRRLEERVGVPLVERSTRHVALTPAGETLLRRARELLALHDQTLRELGGERPGLIVDVVAPGLTPSLVLDAARRGAPHLEFFARFQNGPEPALHALQAGRLDATFGRPGTAAVAQQPVRNEPLAVLLPERHPLAAYEAVPLAALKDERPCVRAGGHATPGWEAAVLQLPAPFGADAARAHPHVAGGDELARHIRDRDAPVLVLATQPPVPGAVLRPLVEPVALFPWRLMWRPGVADHPGLRVLREAVDALGVEGRWLEAPAGAWLPRDA